ncbi:Uncharacterized protein dnm_022050 [Desulfonema magnum]|uniref:Uncharacterized protein n=1 Tax=Desulfonema magnum TaxID=45655 RepID=A0A975BJB2_9BACT|nr:Uncharacterized protein dnm_022050 [Desulfonema magnum]
MLIAIPVTVNDLCTGQKKISAKETRLFPSVESASSGEKSRVSSPRRNFLSCTQVNDI